MRVVVHFLVVLPVEAKVLQHKHHIVHHGERPQTEFDWIPSNAIPIPRCSTVDKLLKYAQ